MLSQEQVDQFYAVCSFHTQADLQDIRGTGASVRRVAADAAEGRYGLEARFESTEGARIEIPVRSSDWRGFGSLVLDAENTSGEPTLFSVAVLDQTGAQTTGHTWWELPPGEKAGFSLSLNAPRPMRMGMEGGPPVGEFRVLRSDHNPVDLERIAAVRISMSNPSGPRTVVFDNFRLGPEVSYEKIVDRFGQYTRADWPGKIRCEADIKSRAAAELAEMNAMPAMPDRDEYGGWAAGPKCEATGFFHTVKQDGAWWLVTPNGHLFFSMGIDSVRAASRTRVEGREQMFEWLPNADDPLYGHLQTDGASRSVDFYTANLERKYGKDWHGQWREMAVARLASWGFNTIGNWSDPGVCDLKRTPYVATLSIRGEMERFSHIPPFTGLTRIPDTFDPRFPEAVEQSVSAMAGERRGDPWLIGYYVDNELNWGFMRNDRTRYALALEVLSLTSASHAKRALVEQLTARYGQIGNLKTAWNARLESWEQLLHSSYHCEDFTEAAREDMGVFIGELAARYFRTVRDTLKKHDPNHLYLGARFAWLVWEDYAWTTREVEDAAAQYCDVLSYNIYLPSIDSRWDYVNQFDKPAMIGEFHFGAMDRGMFHPGIIAAGSQAERARLYREYVRAAASHPSFVGCHYFEFGDQPLTGRGDGENFNIGFVTVTDDVYPEMAAAAESVHAEVYRIRSSRCGIGTL